MQVDCGATFAPTPDAWSPKKIKRLTRKIGSATLLIENACSGMQVTRSERWTSERLTAQCGGVPNALIWKSGAARSGNRSRLFRSGRDLKSEFCSQIVCIQCKTASPHGTVRYAGLFTGMYCSNSTADSGYRYTLQYRYVLHTVQVLASCTHVPNGARGPPGPQYL